MAGSSSRSADMRRIECTTRVLSELSAVLVEFQLCREAWWIELGALEPPTVNDAVAALVRSLSEATARFDAALGEEVEPDPAAEPIGAAFDRLYAELGRLIAEADAALDRLGRRR